jgi:hypothetical protein
MIVPMAKLRTKVSSRKDQRVADLCRNVVPAKALAADAPRMLKNKKSVEKKYGEFLSTSSWVDVKVQHIFADSQLGVEGNCRLVAVVRLHEDDVNAAGGCQLL